MLVMVAAALVYLCTSCVPVLYTVYQLCTSCVYCVPLVYTCVDLYMLP